LLKTIIPCSDYLTNIARLFESQMTGLDMMSKAQEISNNNPNNMIMQFLKQNGGGKAA